MTSAAKPARAYGAHESRRITTDVWLTPRHILDALGDFDLDPCSAPDPMLWPTARHHITLPDDGLLHVWEGRVWLNPPYGKHIGVWMERMALHGRGTALVFARTETALFRQHVWEAATALLFLHRRVGFHHPDGSVPDRSRGGSQACGTIGSSRLRQGRRTAPARVRHRRGICTDVDPQMTEQSQVPVHFN